MKFEINRKSKTRKDAQRLKNVLSSHQPVDKGVPEEIKIHLETQADGNTVFQNLRGAAKAVLRGTFLVTEAYLKRLN